MAKRNTLGRGLGALIDDADTMKHAKVQEVSASSEVSIASIDVNPWQPRTTFDQEALNELSKSIKELGVIQPLTLRKLNNGRYQIIAGERRYRASKLAGLHKVPSFIREVDDLSMLELALVENIQREDLDAIEVAVSYQRLMDECNLTQEVLSDRVGKRRSTITNYLRLLKLPAIIQKAIREREISMGHARALVNVKDVETQVSIYRQIIQHQLSVRKVEEIVRKLNNSEPVEEKSGQKEKYPEAYANLKTHLTKRFDANVDFKMNDKGKGKIVIPFGNTEDLERILGVFDSK